MPETLFSENADCRLTLTATTDADDVLHLHCHVANTSGAVLYLCNRLYNLPRPYPATGEPLFELSPDLVHVQVDAQGVLIDKAIMDLSFHKGIQGLDIPFLTRLPPGQEHTDIIRLALPLLPYRVLGLSPGEAAPTPLPLRFSLGYFVETKQLAEHITEALTTQGPALRIELFLSSSQQTITAGPFSQPVPVANAVGNPSPPPASPQDWTPWGP